MAESADATPWRYQLALSTAAFGVCFAAWGLVSAFAPTFRDQFRLSASEAAMLIAAPVLLGSVARIPVALLGNRFGARIALTTLMIVVAVPVALLPTAPDFSTLLTLAFLAGLAGASFAVGAGHVAKWASPGSRGTAMGVFALGNGGQALVVVVGPVAAASWGLESVHRFVAALLVATAIVFGLLSRDAPRRAEAARGGLADVVSMLRRDRLVWTLSAIYALTFGGFVTFAVYLPTMLHDELALSPTDAGLRAAGFVALATVLRPVGGWLSDRIGGARVLAGALLGIVPFALLLAWASAVPFTVGALGCAALLGVGNGAVLELVCGLFRERAPTAIGIVGAAGGLGGFFPPLVLGLFRDTLGVSWPAFVLLAIAALVMSRLSVSVLGRQEEKHPTSRSPEWMRAGERVRAAAWATLVTSIEIAGIVVGSRDLRNFDPALVIYTFAVVFATWGVVYHYRVWLSKPPTELYWRRGWEALSRGGLHGLWRTTSLGVSNIVAQRFIMERSLLRWSMHQLLFWGCLLAAAVTFPLVFGWLHFTALPEDPVGYRMHVFGFGLMSFRVDTTFAWLSFHALDVAAVMVLAGITLALWRRMRNPGAQALQTFSRDLFPLFILFAISVTGLALTASTLFMRGTYYSFLSLLHAATVVSGLIYLPFGKLFHIFQRPAQLGVKLYLEQATKDGLACCVRCDQPFAPRAQIDDLAEVLRQLERDYVTAGEGVRHWQQVCPPCKRKSFALATMALQKKARG